MTNACATCCAGMCRAWQMTFSKAACGTNWTGWMRAAPRGDGHGGCPGGWRRRCGECAIVRRGKGCWPCRVGWWRLPTGWVRSAAWTCAGCWRAGWPWCVACWPILWRSGGCEVQPATGMTQKAVERPFGRSTAFCVVCDFTAGLVEIRAGVHDFRIVADVLVDGVGQRVHVAVVQLGDFRCGIEGTRAVRCLGWQHHVHARVAFDGLR